jgi:hypothetical protein
MYRFSLFALTLLTLLSGCFWQSQTRPPVTVGQPTPTPNITPTPSSVPSATPRPDARPVDIQLEGPLSLGVGEEMLLTGSVQFSDGTQLSLLQALAQLTVQVTPSDVLQLDVNQLLIRGLKAGDAQVRLQSRQSPELSRLIAVKVVSGIDPNTAILDLEIE